MKKTKKLPVNLVKKKFSLKLLTKNRLYTCPTLPFYLGQFVCCCTPQFDVK